MHALHQTMAGRACVKRLVARAVREGMTIQQFGAAYREERGWGDSAVASLLALWATGGDPESIAAERDAMN